MCVVATTFLAAAPASIIAAATPTAPIFSLAALPAPYDPLADDHAQVAAGQAKARAGGKLLLVDMGGNWCADCRLLSGVMDLPLISKFINALYVVVIVDAGHMNKNLDIAAHWGVDRLDGVPSLLIVDRHDRLVSANHIDALADARSLTPQAIVDWLAQWTP